MNIRLKDIEELVFNGDAIPVNQDSLLRHNPIVNTQQTLSYIVETDEGKFFYKRYTKKPKLNGRGTLKKIIFDNMVYSMPATRYINYKASSLQETRKEAESSRIWDKLGIKSPKLIFYDGGYIVVFEFLRGHSMEEELNIPNLNEEAFSRTLDSLQGIRDVAKKYRNLQILHSDPYANNFFYDEKSGLIMPIDSSKIIRDNMNFEEADCTMNLFFLYKIFHLKTKNENHLRYLEQAVDRYSKNERQEMFKAHFDPLIQRFYFTRIHKLPEINNKDIYFRKDIRESIQESLSK